MARIARRGRTDRSGPGTATVAARKGAWGIARIVNLIARVIAAILVATILLVVLEANRSNGVVEAVLDAGRFLAGPFKDMFNLDNAKTQVAVNYGIAAVVYLAVAGLITRLLGAPLRRYWNAEQVDHEDQRLVALDRGRLTLGTVGQVRGDRSAGACRRPSSPRSPGPSRE